MATTRLNKEKALVEDLDLGMGTSSGTRAGSQINATNIPFDATRSIAEELATKESTENGDTRYAFKNGEVTQKFSVATAEAGTDAVNLDLLGSELLVYPLTAQVVAALETKADLNGASDQPFNVFSVPFNEAGPFPAPTETVNFSYMNDWFTGLIQPAINDKADKTEIISKVAEPTTPYAPALGWHPANKQYVDDKVTEIGAGDMARSVFVNDGTANEAVFSTKNLGSIGGANGLADADKGVLKLSEHAMLDTEAIVTLGIGIFIGVDVLNSPPASAGIPIAIEQMDMNGTGVMIGQRATTDIGVYNRFGFDSGSGMVFSLWKHTLQETDYATAFAGGTVKLVQTGSSFAMTTDGSGPVIP